MNQHMPEVLYPRTKIFFIHLSRFVGFP